MPGWINIVVVRGFIQKRYFRSCMQNAYGIGKICEAVFFLYRIDHCHVEQHLQGHVILVSLERLDEEGRGVGRQHVQRNDAHLGVVQSLASHEDELANLPLPGLEVVGHLPKVLAPPRAVDARVHLDTSSNSLGRKWYNNATPHIQAVQFLRCVELGSAIACDVQVE